MFFKNTDLDKRECIIGEIDKAQLLSDDNEFIIVKNRVLVNNAMKQYESIIFKADVTKIIVLKTKKFITFNKVY